MTSWFSGMGWLQRVVWRVDGKSPFGPEGLTHGLITSGLMERRLHATCVRKVARAHRRCVGRSWVGSRGDGRGTGTKANLILAAMLNLHHQGRFSRDACLSSSSCSSGSPATRQLKLAPANWVPILTHALLAVYPSRSPRRAD